MNGKKEIILILQFAALFIFYDCFRARINSILKEKEALEMIAVKDLTYDNEVINQTIQTIIDSLDYSIKVNLEKDYVGFSKIFVGDSISDFGYYSGLFDYDGVHIDSINFSKKGNLNIDIKNKQIHNGKEIKLISSYKEYTDLVNSDYVNRVLLVFSRVYFNKTYDEGIFTVAFSCSDNAGSNYTVYVIKENNRWDLKGIFETTVR
jgi:hypothetical protein